MKNIQIFFKKLIIYLGIIMIAVPVGILMMCTPAPKAKAAGKIPTTVQNPKLLKKEVSKPVLKTTRKVEKKPEVKEQIVNIRPKIVPSETEIFFAFGPVKGAQKYLVSYNEVSLTTFHLKVIEKTSFVLTGLEKGTLYEIEITPINRDQTLQSPIKFNIKTLGEAPVPVKVANVQTRTMTSRIGSGISTEKKVAPQDQVGQAAEQPKKDEEKNEGGWNRFLVALAILVIAAGAAIGGYYGYEWYASRSTEEPPSSGESGSNSRW